MFLSMILQSWIQKHFSEEAAATTARNVMLLLARDGDAVFQRCCCGGHRGCEGLHGEGQAITRHEVCHVMVRPRCAMFLVH